MIKLNPKEIQAEVTSIEYGGKIDTRKQGQGIGIKKHVLQELQTCLQGTFFTRHFLNPALYQTELLP